MKKILVLMILAALCVSGAFAAKKTSSASDFYIKKDTLKQYVGNAANVVIPEGISEIDDNAFFGCTSVKSITVPNGVDEIGDKAFMNCTSLTSVTLPGTLRELGDYAFKGCTSLKKIDIPAGVMEIGRGVFAGCKGIKITSSGEYPDEFFRSDFRLDIRGNELVEYAGKDKNVTIPKGIREIGEGAFQDNKSVVSVIIPEGVSEIDDHAFEGCSALKSVTVPKSVRDIDDRAFDGCPKLVIKTPKGSYADRYAQRYGISVTH